MTKQTKKEQCKSCYGKMHYTQIFGRNFAPDFIGDKRYKELPTIHKIACPTCNWRNKKKLRGVMKTIWE